MERQVGPIVLLGSGETAPSMQKVYHRLFAQLGARPRVAILETPAGFEPNSADVAGQIGAYLHKRLQNFQPQLTIVPARARGTSHSPDDPAIVRPLYDANVLFMGPGSPTYAVRQLRGSLAWQSLRAMHRHGAALVFSSAAVLAAGRWTLPIYEIYKVGEDLHWKRGLDFFRDFGLSLVFVSHWNNNDGGQALDTSRCYIGRQRFEQLLSMLPRDRARRIVGIDEATALIIDPEMGHCDVLGAGGVTIQRGAETTVIAAGERVDIGILGRYALPRTNGSIPEAVWDAAIEEMETAERARSAQQGPDATVLDLAAQRAAARTRKDWAEADRLRARIETAGWRVLDTPDGPQLEPIQQADAVGRV